MPKSLDRQEDRTNSQTASCPSLSRKRAGLLFLGHRDSFPQNAPFGDFALLTILLEGEISLPDRSDGPLDGADFELVANPEFQGLALGTDAQPNLTSAAGVDHSAQNG